MKTNFELIFNDTFQYEGMEIDFYNDFDFNGFDLNINDQVFNMYLHCSENKHKYSNQFGLTLIHRNIKYIQIIGEDFDNDNAKALCQSTYFPSSARNENEGFTHRAIPNEDDDIIYFFDNGQIIRIQAKEIELEWIRS